MRSHHALIASAALLVRCVPDTKPSPTVTYNVVSPSEKGDGGTGVARKCSPSAEEPCVLRGGEDSLVVRATFEGIDVPSSSSVQPPMLSILADGATLAEPPMSAIGTDPRAFVSTPFLAPARAVQTLTVRLAAAPGYELTDEGFEVKAPIVTLEKACGMGPATDEGQTCTRTLGQATFTYTAWVPGGSRATLSSLIDGVPNDAPMEQTLRARSGRPAVAVFSVPVPDKGKKWTIDVDTEGAPRAEEVLVLDDPEPPSLSVFGCTSSPDAGPTEVDSCERGAGVSLQVTVPNGVHAMEATVRALIDSVYSSHTISVPLDISDEEHQLGVAEVVLPTAGRTVQYRAAVGQSFANPVSIKLLPPSKKVAD